MRCFDTPSVAGNSRVPVPPANIMPFIEALRGGCNLRSGVDRQLPQPLPVINPFRQRPPPITALKVPDHRATQAALETFARRPIQFIPDAGTIERIAEVMRGGVRDKRNEPLATANSIRRELVNDAADLLGHIDVASFGIAANEVRLTDTALR